MYTRRHVDERTSISKDAIQLHNPVEQHDFENSVTAEPIVTEPVVAEPIDAVTDTEKNDGNSCC